jgi:hypothetical protein
MKLNINGTERDIDAPADMPFGPTTQTHEQARHRLT